jgi:hypothetical protein
MFEKWFFLSIKNETSAILQAVCLHAYRILIFLPVCLVSNIRKLFIKDNTICTFGELGAVSPGFIFVG